MLGSWGICMTLTRIHLWNVSLLIWQFPWSWNRKINEQLSWWWSDVDGCWLNVKLNFPHETKKITTISKIMFFWTPTNTWSTFQWTYSNSSTYTAPLVNVSTFLLFIEQFAFPAKKIHKCSDCKSCFVDISRPCPFEVIKYIPKIFPLKQHQFWNMDQLIYLDVHSNKWFRASCFFMREMRPFDSCIHGRSSIRRTP